MTGQNESSINQEFPLRLPAFPFGMDYLDTQDALFLRYRGEVMSLPSVLRTSFLSLLRAIDGQTHVKDLATASGLNDQIVSHMLWHLWKKNMLIEGNLQSVIGVSDQKLFSYLSQVSGQSATSLAQMRRLQSSSILLVGSEPLLASLRAAFKLFGVERLKSFATDQAGTTLTDNLKHDLVLFASPLADYDSCLRLNKLCRSLSIPWIAAWCEGPTVVVTHVMTPSRVPCFECLYLSHRANLADFRSLSIPNASLGSESLASPPERMLLELLIASVINHYGMDERVPFPSRLLEFSTVSMSTVHHPVLRVPDCPTCGQPTSH